MTYITREDSITVLSLSNRVANCLHRERLHTVGDVLDYSQRHDWLELHSIGQKTADELAALVNELRYSEGEYRLIEQADVPKAAEATTEVIEETTEAVEETETAAMRLWEDVPVEKLFLSVRAQNCLTRNGFRNASQLLNMTLDDLMQIKNMGRKTAREIVEKVKELPADRLIAGTPDYMQLSAEGEKHCAELAKEMACYGRTESAWLREISETRDAYPQAQGETFLYRLYDRNTVSDEAVKKVLCQTQQDFTAPFFR